MTQEEFFAVWSPERGALVVRTSGSTGKPKEIYLSAEMVLGSAERTNRFFGIGRESRLHVPLDFNYIAAKMMGVRASLAGALLTSEIPTNRPLSESGKFSRDEVIDLLAVVPSQMEYILDHLTELPELKAIIIGGGVIPDTLKKRIVSSGLNAWETYGMTETASHIALRRVGDDWFETLDGIEVSLSDNDCLLISIEGFRPLTTNDVAVLKDSRHFKIVGRADNVINTGGKKVYAEEVEKELAQLWPGVEFAITSVPDDKWGERIVAVIAAEIKETDKLLKSARSISEKHKIPKEIYFIADIPLTTNGKIDRKALKRLVTPALP